MPLPEPARRALHAADLVVGSPRLLGLAPPGAHTVALGADLTAALDQIASHPGSVCVLASGDPGFFGIVRPLAARVGPENLEVHPAPSSVAVAFARLGVPWDDAVVVSAHGRPLADAAKRAVPHPKVAVLTSPDSPPEALGKELLALGASHSTVAVASLLGHDDERVEVVDLRTLADRSWDPLSVVVLLDGDGLSPHPSLAWGLPEDAFVHRAGMITKAEVRAVVVGKLGLPRRGVVWDVGAGSGSVAVECARLGPALDVIAIERRTDDARLITANAATHRVRVRVVIGEAPGVLAELPDPDRAFVGGGGLPVLEAVLERLRPGGRVVATYAAVDRAVAAADLLGELVQLSAARAERLPDGGMRLAAANPVFIASGPATDGQA